jgi:hypothetical protein
MISEMEDNTLAAYSPHGRPQRISPTSKTSIVGAKNVMKMKQI